MSVYRSEAILNNVTANDITISTITIKANNNIMYWKTNDSGSSKKVLDIFNELNLNKTALDFFVLSGDLVAVQDGLTLNYDQFLISFASMADAISRSTDVQQLLLPADISPVQSNGTPIFAMSPRTGKEWVIGTHNFADKCTWFHDSVRVTDETLVLNGAGDVAQSIHQYWIDASSGRFHNDKFWSDYQKQQDPGNPHGYSVIVKIDGVLATMRTPFSSTGGDYRVNYKTGAVEFFESQKNKVITASYSYATSSVFYIKPKTDTLLVIEEAEGDFSIDVFLNDCLSYSLWYYDVQTSQMVLASKFSYDRISQIIIEAKGNYSTITRMGASEDQLSLSLDEFRMQSRGMFSNWQAIPFSYLTSNELSTGMELRVQLENDIPCTGEHCSMTFYCTENDQE